MLLSNLFTSAVLLASAAVNALPHPISAVGVEGIDNNVIVARGLPKEFLTHAAAAIRAFGPQRTKTMMHSGIGTAKALQIANAKSLQTLETTLSKAIIEDQRSKKNIYKDTLQKYLVDKVDYLGVKGSDIKDWMAAWEIASQEWANFAENETTLATTKKGPNANSFFKRIEEPILTKHKVKITVDDKEG